MVDGHDCDGDGENNYVFANMMILFFEENFHRYSAKMRGIVKILQKNIYKINVLHQNKWSLNVSSIYYIIK